MEWNAGGQLKRVLLNGNEVAHFSYDPYGRRVEKVAGGVTTSYLYAGEDVLREVRGGATFKYLHGPGIDEPLAREDGAARLTYYHADGLSSVVKRTSQAGAVVHEYRYDAWGRIEAGSTEPGYAFTGREWDPETGLAYYRARYYDPRAGRFTSEDPIGFSAGVNFYSYARNAPVLFNDPSGRKITMAVTVLDMAMVDRTCRGTPGATCLLDTAKVAVLTGCREECGHWKFDATVSLTLQQQFAQSPSSRSPESPGLPLKQHEDLHLQDLLDWYSEESVNKEFQSEGFTSKPLCDDARLRFLREIGGYIVTGLGWTEYLRDPW